MCMLTFTVVLGTRAPYSETSYDFFVRFFFESERMTQNQEMHSMLNKKKWGDSLIYTRLKINKLFTFFTISVIFLKMGKHMTNFTV